MWPHRCPAGLSLPSSPGPGLGRQMAARSLFMRSICCRRAASRSPGSGVLWGYLWWASWQKCISRCLHALLQKPWRRHTVISESFGSSTTALLCVSILKRHLCPVWLCVSASSVTPAVEKEVDSSSVPIFLSWANGLSGSCLSPTGSDEGGKVWTQLCLMPLWKAYIVDVSAWVPLGASGIKTRYSITCWDALRRTALLLPAIIKWQ